MKLLNIEKTRTIRIMGIWIFFLSLFIAQLLFYTWCRVQCVQVGYEITQETEKYRRLLRIQNNLTIEISRLKSPERIARIARNRFGLKTPGVDQMIMIHEIH